jgi:hypothetical protein
MKINDCLYEGIKKSMIDDLKIAYEVFKEEKHENLEGVILALNPQGGFSKYLKENPAKLAEFFEYLYVNLDFVVHISFNNDGEDEFYPFLSKK